MYTTGSTRILLKALKRFSKFKTYEKVKEYFTFQAGLQ